MTTRISPLSSSSSSTSTTSFGHKLSCFSSYVIFLLLFHQRCPTRTTTIARRVLLSSNTDNGDGRNDSSHDEHNVQIRRTPSKFGLFSFVGVDALIVTTRTTTPPMLTSNRQRYLLRHNNLGGSMPMSSSPRHGCHGPRSAAGPRLHFRCLESSKRIDDNLDAGSSYRTKQRIKKYSNNGVASDNFNDNEEMFRNQNDEDVRDQYEQYEDDDDDYDDSYNYRFPRRRDGRNSLARYYDEDSELEDLSYDDDGEYDYDDDYNDSYMDVDDDDYDYDDERSRDAAAASGNYWSNPTGRMDRPPKGDFDDREVTKPQRRVQSPSNRQRPRRTIRPSSDSRTDTGNDRKRSSIQMNSRDTTINAFKGFYDRVFWSGFDPDDSGPGGSGVGDETVFGGTKGKFNGLAFYRAAEKNIGSRDRPRSRSKRRKNSTSTRPRLPPAAFASRGDGDDGSVDDDGRIEFSDNYDKDFDLDNDIRPDDDADDIALGYNDETISYRDVSQPANDAYRSGKFRPGNRAITPPARPFPVSENTTRLMSTYNDRRSSSVDKRSIPRTQRRRRPLSKPQVSYEEGDGYYNDGYDDRSQDGDGGSRIVSNLFSSSREEAFDDQSYDYYNDDELPSNNESARRYQRRRQRSTQSGFLGWSPIDAVGNFFGSDWNRMADEYDEKMGIQRNRRDMSEQRSRRPQSRRRQRQQQGREDAPIGPRVSSRDFPNRPGYAYRYDVENSSEDEEDRMTVVDIDVVKNDASELSDRQGRNFESIVADDDNNVETNPSSRRTKELSWEERALAVERVPPATIPAWGPQGELPMNARMKAVVDALQDIETARRNVQRRKKKKSLIEDELSALKLDIKRDRLRLEQGVGAWDIEEELRRNELDADDLSLDLRKVKLQIEYAQAELDDLQERHWAVLSFYSPELASNAISEALGEFSGGSSASGKNKNGQTGASISTATTIVAGVDVESTSPPSDVNGVNGESSEAGPSKPSNNKY